MTVSTVSNGSDSVELTVAFVDLVRFTSLTAVHGDIAALNAAVALEEIASESLDGVVEIVKTLGDGVLLVAPDPLSALRCATAIVEKLHATGAGADARAGLDHGPVIRRRGDVFGATVNLAARLAALGERGALVMTRPVAVVASGMSLAAVPLGQRRVRGLAEPVELFSVNPCQHTQASFVDPVCGMRVDAEHVADRVEWDGRDTGFCSERCASLFLQNPERYTE